LLESIRQPPGYRHVGRGLEGYKIVAILMP
jgi:hypothetical protein